MIERAAIRPYRLPLRECWQTARGEWLDRRGWLLAVESDGVRGYGDCAPLPAAGTETPEAAQHALRTWADRLLGCAPEEILADLAQSDSATPAVHFAVESALLDLLSRRAGLPLRRLLCAAAADSLVVNTMLGALGNLQVQAVEHACNQGFQVLKIKVGIDAPGAEISRLRELAAALPASVVFRLDANGAWSPPVASRFIDSLSRLPVESLEEPLREPIDADLRGLQSRTPFPLALDESMPFAESGWDPARIPVRRVVLKPAVVGGLRRSLALAQRLRDAGIEVVITSLIESAAGLWPTVQLAAAVRSPIPHGLATGAWLAADLGVAPTPYAGCLTLGAQPGSGFVPGPGWE